MSNDKDIYDEFTHSIEIDGKVSKIVDVSLEELLHNLGEEPDLVHAIMKDTDEGDGVIESMDELIHELSDAVNIKFDFDEMPDPDKDEKLGR